ncbi:MAG: hypothetical protein LEGION0403_FIIPPAGN_00886 [Legionella sp.]
MTKYSKGYKKVISRKRAIAIALSKARKQVKKFLLEKIN